METKDENSWRDMLEADMDKIIILDIFRQEQHPIITEQITEISDSKISAQI